MEEAEQTLGQAMIIGVAIVSMLLGVAIGGAIMYQHLQPTPLQKMAGIHDHMRSAEIRYIWRQVYCGKE